MDMRMSKKGILASVAVLLLLLVVAAACSGKQGEQGPQGDKGATGAQGTQGIAGATGPAGKDAPIPPGDGVKITITKVEIPTDRRPVVSFTLADDAGNPLTLADVDDLSSEVPIPGVMNVRFTIAHLQEDAQTKLTQWQSYVLAPVQGQPYTFEGEQKQPAIAEGTQPNILMDMGGSYKEVGDGAYTYTFATVLPEGYDKNATHRVGGETSRDERKYVANATFDLVPAGGAVTVTRQVVATANCNQCHNPLALHGGLRQDTRLCAVCHTSQNVDPESGNVAEFKVMVHKIHRGSSLPSVMAGDPYYIVGFFQTVADFSTVALPAGRDIRTCTVCHKDAPNAENYKTAPSRAACGSCHDNIDFATGKAVNGGKRDHPGGAQANDQACAICHAADSGNEFDTSVVGAHTVPNYSKQLGGLKVEIVRVTDTGPGEKPTVVFKATDNAGNVLPLSAITSLAFNVKGPTTDYLGNKSTQNATLANVVTDADGNFAYTLTQAIPADAKGTWAIGMEVGRSQVIKGNEGADLTVNQRAYNPVAYVPVTDEVAVPRRLVVATEKCNACHQEIAFHGGGRKNTAEYCQLCHNPANVDVPAEVPASLGGPYDVEPQSINFRLMIHRIHTGEELTRDFTIYRTRGVFNFNEVRFPGDRRVCETCHLPGTYLLPLPVTNADTVAPREFYSPLGPAASACTGCHDAQATAAHAATMTSPTAGEACAVCHGTGKDFDVAEVHRR